MDWGWFTGFSNKAALLNFNQAITLACAFLELVAGTLCLCYFMREYYKKKNSWRKRSLEYQLALGFAVFLYGAGMRDSFGALGWNLDAAGMIRYMQQFRLFLQIPRLPMCMAMFFVIRAVSYEVYENKLTVWVLMLTVVILTLGLAY
jgi:hypothetical protein